MMTVRHFMRSRWVWVVLLTAAVIGMTRWKFIDLVRVRGASMVPFIAPSRGWLLIDRRPSTLESVTRGDVVVFEESGRYAVKRIVGTAGDSVSMRGGDVWLAREGQVATRLDRPREWQETQRMPVFPLTGAQLVASKGFENVVQGNSIHVDAAPEQDCSIVLRRGDLEGPSIHDIGLGEDGQQRLGGADVSDVRIRIDDVRLKSEASAFLVTHSLPSGAVAVQLHRNGIRVFVFEDSGLRPIEFPGVPTSRVVLDTLDGFMRLGIPEGDSVRWIWTEPRNTTELGLSTVSFRVVGGPVKVGSIEIDRDVHYVADRDQKATPSSQSATYVPDGHVYVLGDQPTASRDSRHLGCISRMQLRGKVITSF